MHLGGVFGFLFFFGLFGAAFLSAVAALEVLVGGLVDNTSLSRKRATALACSVVYLLALPPMINFKIFLPWDLTFGSGMQVLGSLLAVATVAWCFTTARALEQLAGSGDPRGSLLIWWLRIVVPAAILAVGVAWLADAIL